MLCADCHQKQVIHHTLLQDWRNLRKVRMMHLDVGGTFLTRHYALMVWFPHELIDAATYGIRYSRVSKLGNTGDKGPSHSRTIQKTPSLNHVSNQKWGLHLKKRWIPKLEVQLQENQWQESSIYLWMISLEQVEPKWKNQFWADLEKTSKLVQKIGTMLSWQNKEFAGHKIPQKGRTLKSIKTRPLRSWRKFAWNETRKKLPLHSFNAHEVQKLYRFPMLLQIIQMFFDGSLQQLVMLGLSTNWRDRSSHSQWSFNTGHSLAIENTSISWCLLHKQRWGHLKKAWLCFWQNRVRDHQWIECHMGVS